MNEFIKLRELVLALSKVEIKFLRKTFNQLVSGNTDSQMLLLLRIILRNSNFDYKFCVLNLYGYDNQVAFKKLCQRLAEKILDCLISKDILSNESLHSERHRELFQIKRRFLYYDVLSIHGLNSLALINLNQIIKGCKDLEYFDYLLIALNTKLIRLSRRSGIKSFNKLNDEIAYYNRCNLALNKSSYLLGYFTSLKNSGEDSIMKDRLQIEIEKLEEESIIIKSTRIKSSLFYLKGILLSNEKQYEKAKINFHSFYAHLKRSSSKINKNNDLLNCLLNICEFEIKTFEFKKAISYFEEIDNLKIVNKFNLDIINEMKFLCFLSIGEITSATNHLSKIVEDNDEFESTELHNDRLSYYYAVTSFIDGEFKKCLNYLTSIVKIDKKFIDWNLCIRLLMILCFVEMDKITLIESHLENLRKFLDSKGNNSVLRKEFKFIVKVLSNLTRNGFNYKLASTQIKIDFETFNTYKNDSYFDFRSPNLIPFTPWFKSKLKNVPYDHSAAMREMRRNYKAEKLEMA